MRRPRFHRLVTLLALAALCVATTAFLAHGHQASGPPQDGLHCGLCLQFGGTAGASAAAEIAARPTATGRVRRARQRVLRARRRGRRHTARAPPLRHVI